MIEHGIGWNMHLGDCLKVMESLVVVDHVITDPPYSDRIHRGVRSSGRNRGLTDGQGRMPSCSMKRTVELGFESLTASVRRCCASEFARLAERWTVVFSDTESEHLWRLSLEANGLQHIRTCFWDRVNGAPQFTGDRPAVAVEAITLAHPEGRKRWQGGGKRGLYSHPIVLNRGGQNAREHTTQKPIELMLELVNDFTDPDETVLDPFAGSGTTGVACLRLGRKFIGIEKEPKYFALACDRLRAEENGSTLKASRAGQEPLFR